MSTSFESERVALEKAVVAAAKKVHEMVAYRFRTPVCVHELKDAVKALEEYGG